MENVVICILAPEAAAEGARLQEGGVGTKKKRKGGRIVTTNEGT